MINLLIPAGSGALFLITFFIAINSMICKKSKKLQILTAALSTLFFAATVFFLVAYSS